MAAMKILAPSGINRDPLFAVIAVLSLAGLVPVLGPLASFVDILFIFGASRRCVHDLIAGTQVVRVGPKTS